MLARTGVQISVTHRSRVWSTRVGQNFGRCCSALAASDSTTSWPRRLRLWSSRAVCQQVRFPRPAAQQERAALGVKAERSICHCGLNRADYLSRGPGTESADLGFESAITEAQIHQAQLGRQFVEPWGCACSNWTGGFNKSRQMGCVRRQQSPKGSCEVKRKRRVGGVVGRLRHFIVLSLRVTVSRRAKNLIFCGTLSHPAHVVTCGTSRQYQPTMHSHK